MKPAINPDKLQSTVRGLEYFVDGCLGLDRNDATLSGLEYTLDLLEAAYANSYVETVGEHADSLHMAVKATHPERVIDAYLARAARVGARHELAEKTVVLAFDHTTEDFYGRLESPYLHTWTGEDAVTGKWKFLTAAIVNHRASEPKAPRVPILSIPTPVGTTTAREVEFMIRRVRPLVAGIALTLFDRGFYHLELMRRLDQDLKIPYLIFSPKTELTAREFAAMTDGERKTIVHEYRVRKDKTQVDGQTTLAFLKQIYSKRLDKHLDWVFATNQESIDLSKVIPDYMSRWGIETGFRVQDEAHVKSRSTEPIVRYFHFAFEQALQFSWGALYKPEAPYKGFLKQLVETSRTRVDHVHKKRARRAGAGS